ncbi:MAG TPA: ROK family protein [Blastocatellia bacterium]|nr:ROK family protein [Blastocatellia bacterium]
MGAIVGVMAAEHIAAGLVENNQLVGPMRVFPEDDRHGDSLTAMPAPQLVEKIIEQIHDVRQGSDLDAVGVGFPGMVSDEEIHESPNLPQIKGQNLGVTLQYLLEQSGIRCHVHIINDADAIAAGIAATRGHLDKIIRVWFLGTGIGFGRYPQTTAYGEGGHSVVTLDPKENYCSCGGIGHLEGIMGHRAMRLRFLDLEPEEVFEEAAQGDGRCVAFVELWHRALAAATATSIHYVGPGKFYVTGPNAKFVQPNLMQVYLHEMVKMSSLQGSALEVVATGDEIAIVGAAVSAYREIMGPEYTIRPK